GAVCVHGWLSLPQQSLACHLRVKVTLHPLVIRVSPSTLMVTLVPQQASTAVGGSKFQPEPQRTVLFVAQASTGGVVSTSVTVWLQVAVAPQQSLACHVRVICRGQTPLVRVFRTVTAWLLHEQV